MTLRSSPRAATLLIVALLSVSGCDWLGIRGPEYNNALLRRAETCRRSRDYDRAIALLEQALAADPRLARAHWDLALIYYEVKTKQDYPAAIYHFRKLLELEPDWPQKTNVLEFIEASKKQICQSVQIQPEYLEQDPLLDRMGTELEKTRQEKQEIEARLRQYVGAYGGLRQQYEALRRQYAELQRQRNTRQPAARSSQPPSGAADLSVTPLPERAPRETQAGLPGIPPSGAQLLTSLASRAADTDRTVGGGATEGRRYRDYAIKRGDTLSSLARQTRGVTLSDLKSANPGINHDRLRVGQVIRIPVP